MPKSLAPSVFDPLAITFDNRELKRRSLQGSIVTGLAQILKIVISLGSQIILARLLFPSDYGLLAMVYPIIGLIQVLNDLGFGQVIIQRPVLEQERVSSLFWVNIALSVCLALTMIILSPVVAWLYNDPRVIGVVVSLAALIPIATLGIHPAALLTRQMNFRLVAAYEIVSALIGAIVTVVAAKYGLSYWSLVVGQFGATLAGVILSWIACRWRPSRPALHPELMYDLKFSGNITGANLANYITASADNVIVGAMNGQVALGLYDRSYRLVVQPIAQIISPLNRVALPLLSRLVDRPHDYRNAYLLIARLLMLLTMPAMLVCIANAEVIIGFLLGPRWLEAAPIFMWICVGGLTSSIYSSSTWLFISQGRTKDMRKFLILSAVINIASFLVGSIWGIVALATSAACIFVLVTTPLVLFGATSTGPVKNRDIAALLLTYTIKSAVVFGVLLFQAKVYSLSPLAQIIFATILAYGSYAMMILTIPPERRAFLAALSMISSMRTANQ